MPPHITEVTRPQAAMKHIESGKVLPNTVTILTGV